MDRESRILSALTHDTDLWSHASKLPPEYFLPVNRELFRGLRDYYVRYGGVPQQDAVNESIKRMRASVEQKKEILKLYYGLKAAKMDSSPWDIDALKEEKRKEDLVDRVGLALQALKEGVEFKGKFLTGVEGAYAILQDSDKIAEEITQVSAFEAYMRRKQKLDVVPLKMLSPLVKEMMHTELWILMGFASEGKTTMATNLSREIVEQKRKLLYATLETPALS